MLSTTQLNKRREQLLNLGSSTSSNPRLDLIQSRRDLIKKQPKKTVVSKKEPQTIKLESPKSVFDHLQNAANQVGKFLQKTPNLDLGSKGQKTFKATDTETAAVNFISNMPSQFLQSWGQTIEQLSTDEGRERAKNDAINLPKTVNKVKTHVENKEWQKAYDAAMANSAFTIALDVSDFIPAGLLTKFGLKGLTKSRATAKTVMKDVIKEVEVKPKKPTIVPGKELGFEEIVDKSKIVTQPKKVEPVVKSEPKKTKPVEIVKEEIVKTETTKKPFNTKGARNVQETFTNELTRISTTAKNQEQLTSGAEKLIDSSIKQVTGDRNGLAGLRTSLSKQMFELAGATGNTYKKRYAEMKSMMVEGSGVEKVLSMMDDKVQKLDELIKTTPEVSKIVTKTSQKIVTERKIPQPIGTGKTKQSKLALGVEAKAVEKQLTESLGDLPEYKKMNMANQADRATKLLEKDPQGAIDIALGKKAPPSDLIPESVFTAVERKAIQDKNISLIKELAQSVRTTEATAMGQRIRALAERQKDSPTKIISDIVKARQEAFERKFPNKTTKEMTEKVVTDIKKRVKTPSKSDWNSFISNLQC